MTETTSREGFFGKLWKHKWVILATTALGAGSAYVASKAVPDTYRSTAVILVVPQRVPEDYVKSTVTTRVDERLQQITTTILSRTRLEQTIEQFNLYPEERRHGIMEDVVQRMKGDVQIQIKSGDAFTVSYSGSTPVTTMKVTEQLASLFIQESLQDRELLAQGTDQFLEGTLQEVRQELLDMEEKLAQAAAKNGGRQPSQVPVLDYEALQQTYKALRLKKEESRIAANLEHRQIGEQFKLLDAPRIPEQPISPNRSKLNAIGALAGLAVGIAFVASRRERT